MGMKKYAKILTAFLLAAILLSGGASADILTKEDSPMKVFHLDCGRKYFSSSEILSLIDTLSENGFNWIELAFGNDGLRFLLDDMSLTYAGKDGEQHFPSDAVTAAVQEGNLRYTKASRGELTQSEMDAIVAYAAQRGIQILPLLNTPGHMDAALYAGELLTGKTLRYEASASTIRLDDADAVGFTRALVQKYIDYFRDRGCTAFNLGADEYANDVYVGYEGIGFGHLIDHGGYRLFADYVNAVAQQIRDAGMQPFAFNDGFYFRNHREGVTFDTDIVICYWTAGWGSYRVCPASELAAAGFRILNTNGNWYYVLGRTEGNFDRASSEEYVRSIPWQQVINAPDVSPIGAMVCLWCDDPSAPYTEEETLLVNSRIASFAESNPDLFVQS